MDNNNTSSTPIVQEENVLAGVVGAFLFSLVGGALWFVLYQIGYLAAISGLVGVICAIKGYSFFSKKESTKGVVISAIMAVLVLVIAWYLCIGTDVLEVYQIWHAEGMIDYVPTYFEVVRMIPYFFAEDTSILTAYLADLAIGLLLSGLGIAQYFVSRNKREKLQAEAKARAAAAEAAAVEEKVEAAVPSSADDDGIKRDKGVE